MEHIDGGENPTGEVVDNNIVETQDVKVNTESGNIPDEPISTELPLDGLEEVDEIDISGKKTNDVKIKTTEPKLEKKVSPLLVAEQVDTDEVIDMNDYQEDTDDMVSLPNELHKDFIASYTDTAQTRLKKSKANADLGIHTLNQTNADQLDILFKPDSNLFNKTMFKGPDGKTIKMYSEPIKVNLTNADASDVFMKDLQSAFGGEVVIPIPLYNSGIWIGIETPTEPEYMVLQYLAAANEKEIGAQTAATVYGNHSVLYNKYAIDLVLNKIKYTNVKVDKFSELRELILSSDINAMINGLIEVMFPNGLKRMVQCANFLNVDNPCNFKTLSKLNPNLTLHVDFTLFSDAQNYHMAKKGKDSVTIEEVKAYQESWSMFNTKTKVYQDTKGVDIEIVYKVPTIEEYITQGTYWTSRLRKTALEVISSIDEKRKNSFIESAYAMQQKSNLLGNYLHYVKSISRNGNTVNSLDNIDKALSIFSQHLVMYDKILDDIYAFINNSTNNIIGIPEYVCPKCKELNNNYKVDEKHRHKKIIPFNVLQVLFTLGTLKFKRIEERV